MTQHTPACRRVQVLGGMAEFIGRTGTVIGREGTYLRVRLDEPVEVAGVGRVTDDLWEPRLLRTVRKPSLRRVARATARYLDKGAV